MSQADVSTVSGESDDANVAPSQPDNVILDISGAPAMVSWVNREDGINTSHHLCHSTHDHLTLQIHCDSSSRTAFIQLKANIAFKARRDKANAFLPIHPEQIQTVAVADDDSSKALATEKLATSTWCLQFVVNRPPALVVPKGDLTPKHNHSRMVLDSLQALAHRTSFSVHIPSATLSKAKLLSFCETVSSGSLQSTPRYSDVASLYGGKGGRVIQHESAAAVASGSGLAAAAFEEQSPPSYSELGMPGNSRPSSHQQPGKKRRRSSSGSDNPAVSRAHQCVPASIESICMKMMERIENGFSELGTRLDSMEQRLADLESCVERHADKLGASIERSHARSSEQVGELRDELDQGFADIRKEAEDVAAVRIDDEMYVVREQLEEFVKDELSNVEETLEKRLEESIAGASISLDFNWNR